MRAWVAEAGSVRLTDVAEPRPAADEAVIAVAAYSINRGETFLLEAPPPHWRPGKDVSGVVIAAAADGSGPAAGARVVGHAPASGWAERAAVPATSLVSLPAGISATTAAALPLAGLTALRLVRAAGSLIGRRLLITGASGGVGHYVTELAVAAGAEVTAVSEHGVRLREFGAHTVGSVAEARGMFDLAMESVGGRTFADVRRKVRPGGTILWFGQVSREPITVDFFDWVDGTAGARIVQFHYSADDHTNGIDLATLVRLVERGRLHPEIGTVRPWAATAETITDLRARRVRGNAVLEVSV